VKRLLLTIFVIAALAVGYGYVVTGREASYRDLIRRGDEAMAAGDYATAIETFSGAIALKGDSVVAYLMRGDAYRRRDELEAALRDLKQAAELDPGAPRPRELLGDVNFARKRFVPAAEHYEAYVGLDDRSPRVLYKLALASYRSGRPARGVNALRKAVAIDDGFAEAYYLMGLCQRDERHLAEALTSLRKAITLKPTLFAAREELAALYSSLGRNDEWITELEALRALDPGPAREVAVGLAYLKAGQSDRAVMVLRRTVERHPGYRQTYAALGRVWLDAAQSRPDSIELSKALEALEKAVAEEPSSEAFTLYGRALLLASDVEHAERMLRQATEKLPADPLAFYHLADAAERRMHFAAARQALLDYMALAGDDSDTRRRAALAVRVADISMRLEDFPVAVIWYDRAAPALAGDDTLLIKTAEARWRVGQVAEARAILDKLLAKSPGNAKAKSLRAQLDRS